MYKKTKILLILVTILAIVVLFGRNTTYKDIPLENIKESVMNVTDKEKFTEGNHKFLKRFYGLNDEDYEETIYLMGSSTMDASELLIIKVTDKSQIDTIENSINARIESQGNSFKDYAPEQYALIQNNELSIKGNYVFFVIGDNSSKMKETFLKEIK